MHERGDFYGPQACENCRQRALMEMVLDDVKGHPTLVVEAYILLFSIFTLDRCVE